jgi:hypothetical protein
MDVPEPKTVKRIVSAAMFLIVSVLGSVFVVAPSRCSEFSLCNSGLNRRVS